MGPNQDSPDDPDASSPRTRVAAWVQRGIAVLLPGADGDGSAGVDHGGSGADGDRLLTDEERILRLLRRSRRMKQSAVVDRTPWSKAKVSRVLSDMEESGEVCRIQVGREKIVALPETQFEAARSPHDHDDEGSSVVAR